MARPRPEKKRKRAQPVTRRSSKRAATFSPAAVTFQEAGGSRRTRGLSARLISVSPTPWTREGRRGSSPRHPWAPHQPRSARDAAYALERGGLVSGEGRVQAGARGNVRGCGEAPGLTATLAGYVASRSGLLRLLPGARPMRWLMEHFTLISAIVATLGGVGAAIAAYWKHRKLTLISAIMAALAGFGGVCAVDWEK